jgi:hypothetical protein
LGLASSVCYSVGFDPVNQLRPSIERGLKMKLLRLMYLMLVFLGILLISQNRTNASPVINYQGRVLSGGTAFSGTGQFRFSLISQDGSTILWNNDGSLVPTGASQALALTVDRGIFSVRLGDKSVDGMAEISDSVMSASSVKLRIQFNDGTNGFQALTPDSLIDLSKFQNTPSISGFSVSDTGSSVSNGAYSRIQSVEFKFPSAGRFLIRDAIPGAVRTVIFFKRGMDDSFNWPMQETNLNFGPVIYEDGATVWIPSHVDLTNYNPVSSLSGLSYKIRSGMATYLSIPVPLGGKGVLEMLAIAGVTIEVVTWIR